MKGIAGYGRYEDDQEAVGCPRANSDMTPCVARDGSLAQADDGVCVGCGENPADLLKDLVREATSPLTAVQAPGGTAGTAMSTTREIELAAALKAWQRFAEHAADRKWSIPLWGAILWDQAITLTEAALAHHATPQAGEER